MSKPRMAKTGVAMAAVLLVAAPGLGWAINVSDGGQPSYSHAIAVPPGVAGMAPQLSLLYAGGGLNGPVGSGWSVQGLSSITRCPGSKYLDGRMLPVGFNASDKLCLDGQRLIQVDPANGVPLTTQAGDAAGLSSGFKEHLTEKDS